MRKPYRNWMRSYRISIESYRDWEVNLVGFEQHLIIQRYNSIEI